MEANLSDRTFSGKTDGGEPYDILEDIRSQQIDQRSEQSVG